MATLQNYVPRLPMPVKKSDQGDSKEAGGIIEERRKDVDGSIIVTKYAKGKLLGKVSPTNVIIVNYDV